MLMTYRALSCTSDPKHTVNMMNCTILINEEGKRAQDNDITRSETANLDFASIGGAIDCDIRRRLLWHRREGT